MLDLAETEVLVDLKVCETAVACELVPGQQRTLHEGAALAGDEGDGA